MLKHYQNTFSLIFFSGLVRRVRFTERIRHLLTSRLCPGSLLREYSHRIREYLIRQLSHLVPRKTCCRFLITLGAPHLSVCLLRPS